MIKFDKPEILSGTKLLAELEAAGVKFISKTPFVIEANGDFYVAIDAKDQSKAAPIIAAHDGTDFTY